MRFDVPFTPEGDYPDFLADHQDRLSSVHFSLYDPALADARQRMETHTRSNLVAGLVKLPDTPKYLLVNARLHGPETYFDPARIAGTAASLKQLTDEASIQGIVFADPYYLQAVSDRHPEVAKDLEAVPSINCLLDSSERVFAMLAMISKTEFRLPTKLVLDRSLNRNLKRLADTAESVKNVHPEIQLHLMANEGCLQACPYKLAHDSQVAMVVEGMCGDRTFAMNRELGCIRRFLQEPGQFLASPFIRPEDVHHYSGLADGIKLCGRNKGTDFLKRVIAAYSDGKYMGNLLDLMDAMGDMADRMDIPNDTLPPDFFEQVTNCNKACSACEWCESLANKHASRMDPGLERL